MEFDQFLPPTTVAMIAVALSIARFENQRWIRARARGVRGASEGFGLFVDMTGGLALVFAILFLIAFFWDHGWQQTVGLFAISFLIGLIWSALIPDSFTIRFLATLAIWPLMIVLGSQVSWFGLLS